MALWEGYVECWKDFVGRSDHYTCLLDYLKTHEECLKPETSKHLLSIGPGTGEIDHGLVRYLPNLTSYTAVDANKEALDIVKGKLKELTEIQKHYVHGMMETYTGPPDGADIIIMSHIGYYFPDSFNQQIGRALSWLNRGGRILLLHAEDTVNKIIASPFYIHSDNSDNLISVDDVRRYLVDMGVSFEESPMNYTLDVSFPGPIYYGFLSVILKRRATKEEVDKALTALHPHFIAGTKKVPVTQVHNFVRMALWEGYVDCWKDFVGRSDHCSCLLDYLRKNEECIQPETTKHLLSIGPGTGELDHGLVSLLPNLTGYTAVEPNVGALDTVKGRLEEFAGIEKHYVNSLMETYTGPPHGADIILMSHVSYYICDCFDEQIAHALSWLNEGGRILLVQSQDTVEWSIISTFDVPVVDDAGTNLKGMGVKFTESTVDYTLDVSYPGPTYYGFLSVMLKRRAMREEVDKALAVLKPFFIPGTQKLTITQSFFVIQKK